MDGALTLLQAAGKVGTFGFISFAYFLCVAAITVLHLGISFALAIRGAVSVACVVRHKKTATSIVVGGEG
jgi:hypothetical protein